MIPRLVTLLLLSSGCTKTGTVEALPEPAPTTEAPPPDPGAWSQPTPTTTEGATTTSTAATPPAKDDIAKANALLTTKKPSDAQQAANDLRAVVAREPQNAYAHYNLGVAYEILGDQTSARESYLEATRVEPGLGEAWLNLAAMDARSGNYDRAVSRYKLGISHDRENMDLWVGLISALRAQGKLDEAEKEAKAALRINANALNVYNNLGLVYMERGQLDLAYFIVQKAMTTVKGGHENASLHCNLGRIYYLQGKIGDAKLEYNEALKRDDNLVSAMLYLAEIYLNDRNYEDSIPLLEKARSFDPENPDIHMNLGIAYRGVGRYEEAKAAYEMVLRLEPENPEPHVNLGILYGDYMKAYDAAVTEYERYVAMGGPRATEVQGYIEATRKEQERVRKIEERKKKAEAEKAKLDAQKRANEEEQRKQQAPPDGGAPPAPAPDGGATPAPAPDGGAVPAPAPQGATPEPTPAPQPTPATPSPTDNPWG